MPEEKQFYDDGAFYVEQSRWKMWNSYDKDGNCILTSLTEDKCISATRFFLKIRQDEANGKVDEVKAYETKDNYKL
jgi:hypothetical protein